MTLVTEKRKSQVSLETLPSKIPLALAELLQDHSYAIDLSKDIWEFATEIGRLYDIGLNQNDLRWMMGRGWLEHAAERKRLKNQSRTFHLHGRHEFSISSCFVLTNTGLEVASRAREIVRDSSLGVAYCGFDANVRGQAGIKPRWDCACKRLYFGSILVKAFRVPSPNQTTILSAFEEENWPERIDDPLPYSPDVARKERLRYTLKSLNKHQKLPVLHFSGDGSGEGILWEPLQEDIAATSGCDDVFE